LKKETNMTTKEASSMPATQRYRLAVAEFRAAYAQLAAEDRRADRQGFGQPPDIIGLRHALANPNEGGNWADDIAKALKNKPPELIAAEEADKKAADAHAKAEALRPA
jgi:hypothetical protein